MRARAFAHGRLFLLELIAFKLKTLAAVIISIADSLSQLESANWYFLTCFQAPFNPLTRFKCGQA